MKTATATAVRERMTQTDFDRLADSLNGAPKKRKKGAPQPSAELLEALEIARGLRTAQDTSSTHSYDDVTTTTASGGQIALPEGMSARDGAGWLAKIAEDDDNPCVIRRDVKGHPDDVLVQLARAVRLVYGYAVAQPVRSWFGSLPIETREVSTGPDTTETVPTQPITLPGIGEIGYDPKRGQLVARTSNRWRDQISAFVRVVELLLAESSIYRAQAVALHDGQLQFMTATICPEDIVLNEDTRRAVELTVWEPLKRRAELIAEGQLADRSALLIGDVGNGKTLIAAATARIATDSDVTYLYVENPNDLRDALQLARCYAPIVVFCEDLDQLTANRQGDANRLCNELDSIQSKTDGVSLMATSNFPEKIDRAFLRPGRIDSVVDVGPPEERARVALGQLYVPGASATAVVGLHVLQGESAATIREACERARMLARLEGKRLPNAGHFGTAARLMRAHLQLLHRPRPGDEELTIDGILRELFAEILETAHDAHSRADDAADSASDAASNADSAYSRADNAADYAEAACDALGEVKDTLEEIKEEVS